MTAGSQRQIETAGGGHFFGQVRAEQDVVGRDKIENFLVLGDLNFRPITLSAPLRSVFAKLLDDRTQLFAGRDADLARVQNFIRDPAGGYLIVAGPPGFGKTALVAKLVQAAPEAFAYHFFAPLYAQDSVREAFFLRCVVQQIAQWHAETSDLPEESRLPELRALYHDYLGRPLDARRVLVLDGLDEVTGWDLAPYLGHRLPAGLHVILTARDLGEEGEWAEEYGLPRDQTSYLRLEGLSQDGVEEVLRAAGHLAVAFADDPRLLEEIMRVAAYESDPLRPADPFYVRFLAEDAAAGLLTSENMSRQPRGLARYLDTWYADVVRATGEDSARDLFGTLSVALGPIGREELQRLHPRLAGRWPDMTFESLLLRVRRLVICDEHNRYSLAHPRLKEYLRAQIERNDPALLREMTHALHSFCAGWREHASPYALSFYTRHLLEAATNSTLSTGSEYAELFALVDDRAWYEAQMKADPGAVAYLSDLACAWQAAERVNAAAIQAGEMAPLLGREIRSGLATASLRSLSYNIPSTLLAALASAPPPWQWGVDTAVAIANQNPDPGGRSEALTTLASLLPESARRDILDRAVAAARAIQDEEQRALALARLSTLTVDAPGKPLALEALDVARTIDEGDRRARTLASIALQLPEPQRSAVQAESVDTAVRLPQADLQVRALVALAGLVTEELTDRILAAALAIDREAWRSRILAAVASHVPRASLPVVRRAASALQHPGWRAQVNSALAARYPEPDRQQLLAGSLADVRSIDDLSWRVRALATIASRLSDAERDEVLDEARTALPPIVGCDRRLRALATLAANMPEARRPELVADALRLAPMIVDPESRAEMLADLARHLEPEDRLDLLAEALAAVRGITGARWRGRGRALAALAQLLPEQLLADALVAARAIGDEYEQAQAVAALLPSLGEQEKSAVLSAGVAAARAIETAASRVPALSALAPRFGGADRTNLVMEALESVPLIEGAERRALAIVALAPYLPEAVFGRALELTHSIDNAGWRVRAFVALAPCLPHALIDRALTMARAIRREGWRAQALVAIAPRLPEPLRAETLAEARALARANDSPEWRVRALAAIAREVPHEQQDEVVQEALLTVGTIRNATWRVRALVGLVPLLPAPQRAVAVRRALAEADAIEDDESRARALTPLAAHIDDPLKTEILELVLPAVRATADPEQRARALSALATDLARLPRARLYSIWQQTLHQSATRTRRDMLWDLPALSPLLQVLGGAEATAEAVRAIRTSTAWWP